MVVAVVAVVAAVAVMVVVVAVVVTEARRIFKEGIISQTELLVEQW